MIYKIEIYCPICKSTEYRVLHTDSLGDRLPEFGYNFRPAHRDSYRIVRCDSCGHGYASPLPENIYANYVDVVDSEYMKSKPQRLMTAMKVMPVIHAIKSRGKLLDVGCATGDFLDVASDTYEVEGVELSNWAATIASRSGNPIHRKRLAELESSEQYDIVTMWGVIEHFENPRKEIVEINRLLRIGGIVCIWTGDMDSLLSRVLGKRWWYVQGQHIQLFTRQSLERLMKEHGFVKRQITTYPYVMTLKSMCSSLRRYKVIGYFARLLFDNKVISGWRITFKLPGEMFAIFEKVAPVFTQ